MRIPWMTVLVALSATAPLVGQEDAGRERLRQQVMERFTENYRTQAGLSEQQWDRFQAVTRRAFEARRESNQRERELWAALETQMRPGVAANPDSVSRLLDALVTVQEAQAAQLRSDQRAYAEFLSPVQRAQLVISLRRLQNQIERIVRDRLEQGRGGRGMRR